MPPYQPQQMLYPPVPTYQPPPFTQFQPQAPRLVQPPPPQQYRPLTQRPNVGDRGKGKVQGQAYALAGGNSGGQTSNPVMSVRRSCEITIGSERMRADLIILPMSLFDVVLGMDWFSKYGAIVDCYRRRVTLMTKSGTTISYQADLNLVLGERLLKYSVGGRRNLACFSSLLALESEHEITGDSAGILVVDEFTDVFPDELPGLPPDREIEFCIDLVPGTAPISIPPYRMAPAEMKELRTQLEELAEKWRISVDPSKIETVLQWERPKNVAEIHSFLGLTGQRRWVEYMEDYDFTLQYHPGKANVVADALTEHRKPAGELQPLPVPRWKWEHITMDFLMGLPRTELKYDAIWVVVDRLTKSAHFIPFHATYSRKILSELYLEHIVRLHGVPLSITSDRDTRFNARLGR
ncbi:uncharacterized protein LOC112090927 [Morus notabilis]|uniref:uncharacterized protein LOC112090927 n=1 Tax=Morus notabilis TaxID=981085 RepID=UPI000CED3D1F|nr:uncharacterized protein LOC112090927 [Morus notabilis]